MSFFSKLNLEPQDAMFALEAAYEAEQRVKKLNLGIGVYHDEKGNKLSFEAVKKAAHSLASKHSYLAIDGDRDYCEQASSLLLSKDLKAKLEGKLYTAASVGGTGALFLAAKLLKAAAFERICLPEPTWPNHKNIFSLAGLEITSYPYYDKGSTALDFEKLKAKILEAESKTAFLFHGVCHNPSGCDPNPGEWREIFSLLEERSILAIFDIAYQGFGEGIEEDAFAIREYLSRGNDCMIANSFSKNFGLYGQRTGFLTFVSDGSLDKIASQVKKFARSTYSNPPRFGQEIVKEILSNSALKALWQAELTCVRKRVQMMRLRLAEELSSLDYHFLTKQKGLFSYLRLQQEDIKRMQEKYGIYLPLSARVNLAALTEDNLAYLARAVKEFS